MAAAQGFFPVQQPFFCLLDVICAAFPSLPVSRAVAQTQTSRKQKSTQTPDPLRVMHDGFSIFRTIIRQIDEICYSFATNGSFHSPQSRTNLEVISSNLLLNISPYCSYPTNTELSTSRIWFRPIACTASIAASLWLKCRFPTVKQFAPSSVSCC